MAHSATRRWTRQNIQLPIRVMVSRGHRILIVEGRGSALSEGAIYVHAGLELLHRGHNPGGIHLPLLRAAI